HISTVDGPEIQLLRTQKVALIEVLSADADFVLQHADSRGLLSLHSYRQLKACRGPSEKVTDLIDLIIQTGPEAAQGLLELLKDQALQETFPMLKDLQISTLCSENKRKRKQAPEVQDTISSKRICNSVTEKQLMKVARAIGRRWREIGRLALDIPSVKLEQFEEDHSQHVERVFAMLRHWQTCQREKATAARLHSLLSQEDWALPSESIDFLLETD
uniref:Zgc:174906 n=1 Tax=Mastacembelus armatus TaxID=205130 RepID=A0A3Q3LBM6_9TELE